MKKFLALLLVTLLLCVAATALALDVYPGDEFDVTIRATSENGAMAKVGLNFNTGAFSFVSASGGNVAPNKGSGYFIFGNGMSSFKSDSGTVTFRVKSDAKPGNYSIGGSVAECYDVNFNDAACSASSQSIRVLCRHDSGTEWVTTTAPTCLTAGEESNQCKNCNEVMETRPIDALGHDDGTWTITLEPTCVDKGTKELHCTRCGELLKTEEIDALGHTEGEWDYSEKPTCTVDGSGKKYCTVCNALLKDEVVPALGHDDGTWTVTLDPTCVDKGTKELNCTRCGELLKTEEIDALGHTEGEWDYSEKPTCTTDGSGKKYCTVCNELLKDEVVPALGHDDGKWEVTVKATCSSDGEKVLKCTRCSEVLDTEVIPMSEVPHTAGKMKVVTPATCLEEGLKEQHCTKCDALVNSEVIPTLGHDKGRWVIITRATRETEGFKELHCTRCNELLDTAVIPVVTYRYYENNACVYGLRFADYVEGLDSWFTFRPIDISTDGSQTYDLIAGKMHKIGTVTVAIADGKMNVTYALCSKQIEVTSEMLTFFGSISEVTSLDDNSLTSYAFGEDINIADTFGDDTKVLLYVHLETLYSDEISSLVEYRFNEKTNQELMEELSEVMD